MPKRDREAWAERVQLQLLGMLPVGAIVVILAANRYREGIVSFLDKYGFRIEVPLEGLKFGQQLQWLKRRMSDE